MKLQIKRAYEKTTEDDGIRILVFAAKDEEHSNAKVLLDWLRSKC